MATIKKAVTKNSFKLIKSIMENNSAESELFLKKMVDKKIKDLYNKAYKSAQLFN